MRTKRRKWEESGDDDPAAGLINLFDVWIAFAVALLLALVSYLSIAQPNPAGDARQDQAPPLEVIQTATEKLQHYRVSRDSAGGEGERLGTAYRLKNGEVIYVPETGDRPSIQPQN